MSSSLHSARTHVPYRIVDVREDASVPERARQLRELGFLRGEQVVLLRRTQPGNDPLVVRIGLSTFALRRAEAACVHIAPESHGAHDGQGVHEPAHPAPHPDAHRQASGVNHA